MRSLSIMLLAIAAVLPGGYVWGARAFGQDQEAEVLFRSAVADANSRQYDESIKLYSRLLTDFPSSKYAKNALFNRAMAYEALGNPDKAQDDYEKYVQSVGPADPGALGGYWGIYGIERDRHDYEAAIRTLKMIHDNAGIDDADSRLEALYRTGEMFAAENQAAQAKATWEELEGLKPLKNPFRIQALIKLGEIYEADGETSSALRVYQDLSRDAVAAVAASAAKRAASLAGKTGGQVSAPAAAAPASPPSPAASAAERQAGGSDVDEPSYPKVAQRPDDFALVIGISKYRDIPEAEFAENDANAMKRHLMALGYPEENIIMLLGDHATNSSIAEKLERWLPMNVAADSNLFVYYSGHGAPDPESKQAFLVPWDGMPSDLADTAFPLSRFYKDLQKLKAKRVIVALDSCFSGAGGRSVLAKGARPLVTKIDLGGVPELGKLVVFTAAQADQISGTIEDKGHGAFTYYFLKGLNGDADAAGHVTVRSLYDYLSKRVSASAHRQEREQKPQLLPSAATVGSIRFR